MNFNCEQLAGFSEVEFFLLSETSNWPIVLTDQTSAGLIFTPEINDVEGAIEPDSINIDATPKQSVEGTIYDNSAAFKYLTRSESIEQLMEQYANKPGILKAKLNTGFQKIYGTNEEPLIMTFKIEEGQKPEDAAGVIVNIKGETRKRPVYYTPLGS